MAPEAPVIGVGSVVKHRKYNCKVLRFKPKAVVMRRVNTGLVIEVPYSQMPLHRLA